MTPTVIAMTWGGRFHRDSSPQDAEECEARPVQVGEGVPGLVPPVHRKKATIDAEIAATRDHGFPDPEDRIRTDEKIAQGAAADGRDDAQHHGAEEVDVLWVARHDSGASEGDKPGQAEDFDDGHGEGWCTLGLLGSNSRSPGAPLLVA